MVRRFNAFKIQFNLDTELVEASVMANTIMALASVIKRELKAMAFELGLI